MILLYAALLWLVHGIRATLFWVYLWQLKEYHIGRFLDHFRTQQGKRLLWGKVPAVKFFLLILLIVSVFSEHVFYEYVGLLGMIAWLAMYVLESARFLHEVRTDGVRRPQFTLKTFSLVGIGLALIIALLLGAGFFPLLFGSLLQEGTLSDSDGWIIVLAALLLFDLLFPVAISAVVLLFQPLTVLWRMRVIDRAKKRRTSLKRLKVVAITGSYGKTTTKEMLFHILQHKFAAVKTPEHRNSEVGIARTVLHDLTDEHEVFVCEMGAYGKGGIKLLADIAQPDIGVVAGVTSQHLSLFGSMENLLSAEGGGELASSLPKEAPMVVNYDSIPLRKHAELFEKVVWCSAKGKQDVYAKDVIVRKDSLILTLAAGNEEARAEAPVMGAWNAENMVLSAGAALQLGCSIQEAAQGLSSLPAGLGSMQQRKGKGFAILDSSYSANPDGVLAALEHLKLWDKRKVAVMPPLIELGSTGKEVHETIGEKIAECADYAIITGQDYKDDILKGAGQGGMSRDSIFFIENAKGIADTIERIVQEGDVVLLEGRVPSGLLQLLQS